MNINSIAERTNQDTFHYVLSWLPLYDLIQYIFHSTADQESRYAEVKNALELIHIKTRPSYQQEDENAEIKKIMDLSKDLLGTSSFDEVFSLQTLAQVTFSEYSKEPSSFIERMDNPNDPWNLNPDRWIRILCYQKRFHCALQLFETIPPDAPKKSFAGQHIAIAYAREGDTEKALSFLRNIPNSDCHILVYKEIIKKYFEQENYTQLKELLDQGTITDLNLYLEIGKGYSDAGKFDLALEVVPLFPAQVDANSHNHQPYLRNYIVNAMIEYGLKNNQENLIQQAKLAATDLPSITQAQLHQRINRLSEDKSIQQMQSDCDEEKIEEAIAFFIKNSYGSEPLAESLAKALFEKKKAHAIFQLKNHTDNIVDCRKRILQLYYKAGRFDDALSLLDLLENNDKFFRKKNLWTIQTLQERYRWNLLHKEDPRPFQDSSPLPETLIEALETGHYPEAIELLKETLTRPKQKTGFKGSFTPLHAQTMANS